MTTNSTLPQPYTMAEHARRYSHLTPSEMLDAFLALPESQREEAWRSLRVQEVGRAFDEDGIEI